MQKLKPNSIEDLIALLSLYRPGPVKSIPKYIENKHNPKKIKYATPLLEPILNVTYGCIVYQEQVMQIFRTLAGYTLGRADIIRRAMAKKKHEVLQQEKVNFINGCKKNGIDEKIAIELFTEIEAFSSYAFNKAHATAYSIVSYRTAYLKCHYPAFYMAALITSVLNSSSKVEEYFEECKRIGINILPPNINSSKYNFSVENNNIRFGLLGIKGVGKNIVDRLIEERNSNGDFSDLYNFCKRCDGRDLNSRTIEALIKSGCFDNLGYNRREMLENIDNILSNLKRKRFDNIEGQIDLFESSAQEQVHFNKYPEFDKNTLLKFEKEVIGFYLNENPLTQYKDIISSNNFDLLRNVLSDSEKYHDNKSVKLLCFVDKIKKKTTRKGDTMAFASISDITSSAEMLIFPKIFSENYDYFTPDKPLVVFGRVSIRDEEQPQIICERIDFIENYSFLKNLYLKVDSINDKKLFKASSLINANEGNSAVYIYCNDTKKLLKSEKLSCQVTNELVATLKNILGENNVAIK